MSFKSSAWSGFVKQALSTVEGQIDKALDIKSHSSTSTNSDTSASNWGIMDWDITTGSALVSNAPPVQTSSSSSSSSVTKGADKPASNSSLSASFLPLSSIQESVLSLTSNLPKPSSNVLSTLLPKRPLTSGDATIPSNNVEIKSNADVAIVPELPIRSPVVETESDTQETSNRNETDIKETEVHHQGKTEEKKQDDISVESEMESLLKQREKQLISASEQNAMMNETIESRRLRINELERIVSNTNDIISERDQLRAVVAGMNSSTESKRVRELEQQLREKSEQAEQLMTEGKQLSDTNGKLHAAIKKLKEKFQENQNEMKSVDKRCVDMQMELTRSKERIVELEESERRWQSSAKTLGEQNEELQKQLSTMDNNSKEDAEKKSSLQVSLDRAWAEITELRKMNASASLESKTVELERELQLNTQLRENLTQMKTVMEKTEDAFRLETQELRSSLSRLQAELGWKEDEHRREIAAFQQRLQAADLRNEDLAQSVNEATRPLLRQIESLQMNFSSAQQNFQTIEASMTSRIAKIELERDDYDRKCREYRSKIAELERSVLALNQELSAQQEASQKIRKNLEDELSDKKRLLDQFADLERSSKAREETLRKRIASLELDHSDRNEKESREVTEKLNDRLQSLEQALQAKEEEMDALMNRYLAKESMKSVFSPLQTTPDATTASMTSAALDFRVQSLENQIKNLEFQLRAALDSKESLSNDLVQLTLENNKLKAETFSHSALKSQHAELQNRYQTALELLGEKTEEVEELKQDIADMKSVFRNQIQELLAKSS